MKNPYNEGETGGFIGGYSNQYSIQDSSDEDQDMKVIVNEEAKKMKNEQAGRHSTFSLELVFVNKVINASSQTILSKLLSFDSHPRDQKNQYNKS